MRAAWPEQDLRIMRVLRREAKREIIHVSEKVPMANLIQELDLGESVYLAILVGNFNYF